MTTGGNKQVFISCVTAEFGSYREILRKGLKQPNVDVHIQEEFVPFSTPTLEQLNDYIAGSDVVVHLVGDMTGAMANPYSLDAIVRACSDFSVRLRPLAPSLEPGQPPFSYTQWEAYLALYHRKRLLVAAPYDWTPRDGTFVKDKSQIKSQTEHLERLALLNSHPGVKFDTPDTLLNGALKALLGILAEASAPKPIRASSSKPQNLPYPSIGKLFKGRVEFMTDLHASLKRSDGSQATAIYNAVHGLGGIGKTRLAVEYGWRYEADYAALLFVVAEARPEQTSIAPDAGAAILLTLELRRNLAALAGPRVLNLPEREIDDEEKRITAVIRWLQEHPGWLLIIDNVDTDEGARELAGYLPQLRGGHVLITSRRASWPPHIARRALDVLAPDAAEALVLDSTANSRQLATDDAAQATTIARELGYLALALEQAAAYIDRHHLSLAGYLQQWRDNRESVAAWYDPATMTYPMSVAITWQTSVARLGSEARLLLNRLAFLAPEPIPAWLLDEVPSGVDKAALRAALAELEAYSLVARGGDRSTFVVHRLVQDVARRRLAIDEQTAALHQALAWIDQALVIDTADPRNRRRLEPLVPHVRVVTQYADGAGIGYPTTRLLDLLGALLENTATLAGREAVYRQALAINQREASANPDGTQLQRNLSVAYNKVGDVLVTQGNLPAALTAFRESHAIFEHLAQSDPGNTAWRRDLSVSHERIGDMLLAQGNLPPALTAYRESLAIREPLSRSDPANAEWQRDRSVSHNKIGDVMLAQGNLPAALIAYRESLAIREQLAQSDVGNAGWQRDLSASHVRIGDVLVAQDDLPMALTAYKESLAIVEGLVRSDPGNAGWQRDLSVSHNKVGDVLKAQGNRLAAVTAYRDSLAIRERLAKSDPGNAGWQRDLSYCYTRIGDLLLSEGERIEALKNFRAAFAIDERLVRDNPTSAQNQTDLIVSHWRLALHGDESGRRWAWVVETLRKLRAEDRLTADQATWLPEAERQLKNLADKK